MLKPAIADGAPVRKQSLLPFRHTIDSEEINEVVDTLRSDWITTCPKTHRFEEMFKQYVGCKHAIAVNSCTVTLHSSLVLMKLEMEY